MPRAPRLQLTALLLLFGGIAGLAHAQHVLLVQHKGQAHVVRRVDRTFPMVESGGKLVTANSNRFLLQEVEEYLPLFITVRNVLVRSSHVDVMSENATINNRLEFSANFVSAYHVEDVFVVLELTPENGKKGLFIRELGRLQPNEPRSLDLTVSMAHPLGSGTYQLHLFAGGREVLHSQQPFAYREQVLDQMVARRIQGRTDGLPQPLMGPVPEYPPALVPRKLDGHAILRIRILPTGAIVDPEVVSATDPAFGESAAAAFRQWRFLPRIQNGRPVEVSVDMPVQFLAPR
jgi:TonB family C-terminal domain